jgi:hypothetical protein
MAAARAPLPRPAAWTRRPGLWAARCTLPLVLFLVLASGCAGTLVVRAPQEPAPHPGSPLSEIAPLAVAVPAATGSAARADPLGERAGGWGRQGGPITSTERPGDLVRRVVVQELEQAGHRVVDRDPNVRLAVDVRDFVVAAPRAGRGWDVVVSLEVALRVERPGQPNDATEFVLDAETRGHSFVPPGVSFVEKTLAEAVERLGEGVAERDALADALVRHGRPLD